MDKQIQTLFAVAEEYAAANGLSDTDRALQFLRRNMEDALHGKQLSEALLHALETAQMLIDLHLSLSRQEEDVLLAAVLMHIYPENVSLRSMEQTLTRELGFCEEVSQIISTILPPRNLAAEEQQNYYCRLRENKLALLAALADRGNIVQQLHRFSTWNAHHYIDETRACYFPMCIYGKEHYHELLSPISVLMEKMRSLMEVAEILLRRYETREAELLQDILALQEENATIRGIIAKFRS